MTNQHIIDKIRRDVDGRLPKFCLGQWVRGQEHEGIVDAIYANLDAAVDSLTIFEGWYEMQEVPLKTPKNGFWYSVVLVEGAVLLGEDDIDG